MKPEDRRFASPRNVTLRDGRKVAIRLLAPTDAEALADFYAAIPAEDGIYYISAAARTREKALARAAGVDTPYEVCLALADDAGMIHGEAWYRWSAERTQQSTFGIIIRRTMQGVGAGRLIMQRLMEIGDLYGPPVMDLTVQAENERAWKLYVSLGFVLLREQTRAAREDSPAMPEFYMERKMGRRCWAGAASRTINPAIGAHLAGQLYVRKTEFVRDDLELSLLYLANRDGGVCLVSVDNCGTFEPPYYEDLRAIVSRETGVPADRVLICCTHTHAGATVASILHDSPKDDAYLALVRDRLAEAAREAFASARPARIGTATGQARVGFHRRLCWQDG
ncbi:MAG: GNAT family N-acetyltransferase, partial [Phycisphaerae bacterium]|nr:GNAT family N-acetyltransferase [Phycisphaerae bacterium]